MYSSANWKGSKNVLEFHTQACTDTHKEGGGSNVYTVVRQGGRTEEGHSTITVYVCSSPTQVFLTAGIQNFLAQAS